MSAPNSDRDLKEAPCRRRKSLFQRVLHWLKRLIRRLTGPFYSTRLTSLPFDPATISFLSQTICGDRNQNIARMSGGTAIANVNKLIQHFHLSPQEILPLQSFWENWSQETNPPFSLSLVIGGRNQAHDSVLSWLRGSPSPLTSQDESPEEAIAFLAAVVQSLEENERTKALLRAAVVDGATA